MLYILLGILLFGLLIAVHELGHFTAAKLLGVRVNEFSIGMGPQLFSKTKGETQYSLRLLPIGGYCAMEGEDEKSDDPRAFNSQRAWKRLIILVAGAAMNFIAGLVLLFILFAPRDSFTTPVIADFMDGCPYQSETAMAVGDRILSIDGERVYTAADVSMLLSMNGGTSKELVLRRNGQKITLENFTMEPQTYVYQGKVTVKYGLIFQSEPATPLRVVEETWYYAMDFVRTVRLSLKALLTGAAGIKDLSGPVGIVSVITEVGQESETVSVAMQNILYLGGLVAVNLAVVNLLPLPALDGGRIFFLLINALLGLFTKKQIKPEYEGYVHFAGLICLLALMAFVTLNDVLRLFQ